MIIDILHTIVIKKLLNAKIKRNKKSFIKNERKASFKRSLLKTVVVS